MVCKYETYNIGVHATAILFPPPALLILFFADSPVRQRTLLREFLANIVTYLTTLVLSLLVYRVSPVHTLACYLCPFGCQQALQGLAGTRICLHFWLSFLDRYIKSLPEWYGDVVRIVEVCVRSVIGGFECDT
uniref:Mannitol 1-phosphate dehydrogenase n=1 Tax=Ganoderma boninense TaxID=34458 RepID=A0A5K1JZ41_9APHY|nr:Mannitol 1-phosphate dehydrogenase [Ganoderma boninense]